VSAKTVEGEEITVGRKLILGSLSNCTRSKKFPVCSLPSEQPLNVSRHVGARGPPFQLGCLAVPFLSTGWRTATPAPEDHEVTGLVRSFSQTLVVQGSPPPREFNNNRGSLVGSYEWSKSSLRDTPGGGYVSARRR
jgi:hypothetical protein